MIEKIFVPLTLFIVLSPGVFTHMKTSVQDVLLNALIFVGAYWSIARVLGITLTKADLIVPPVLFALLNLVYRAPGLTAVGIRSLVFAVVFAILRMTFSKYY